MESIVYANEFASCGRNSNLLIATKDVRNENYEYSIIKRKDGHLRRCVHIALDVMTVILNRISHSIDCLDLERDWLSRMAFGPLVGKYYNLFCITVYANGCHEWGVSANLLVSDRRIYIGLHEMEAHGDTAKGGVPTLRCIAQPDGVA